TRGVIWASAQVQVPSDGVSSHPCRAPSTNQTTVRKTSGAANTASKTTAQTFTGSAQNSRRGAGPCSPSPPFWSVQLRICRGGSQSGGPSEKIKGYFVFGWSKSGL